MIVGFSGSSLWTRLDVVGKVVLNVIAVVGFAFLALKLRRRGVNVA
jgi:hypothetical protein